MERYNRYWIFLISLIGLYTLGYSLFTLGVFYNYYSLSHSFTPKQIEWTWTKLGDDDFQIEGHYRFIHKGILFNEKSALQTHYLNSWAVEEKIERLKQSPPVVWIDPSNPEHSSLQKDFPWKQLLYTLILWGLILYFIRLGAYAKYS